jgi:ABC-type Mn2+/Zn2+ transport system ATPase subunit
MEGRAKLVSDQTGWEITHRVELGTGRRRITSEGNAHSPPDAVKAGRSRSGRPSATLRSRIAYVPQREVIDWDFPVTVWDVVMMGRYPHVGWLRRPGAADALVVAQVLRQVGMWEWRRTQIGQLSGGQQQRVFVARALAQAADVLLLDEPFNGIDAQTQEVIRTIIDSGRQAG